MTFGLKTMYKLITNVTFHLIEILYFQLNRNFDAKGAVRLLTYILTGHTFWTKPLH